MKKFLYLEPIGGISGDMLVGGLLDLGVPLKYIEEQLSLLSLENIRVCKNSEKRHHISGIKFSVKTDSAKEHPYRSFKKIKKLIKDSELSQSVKDIAIKVFEKLAIVEGKVHNCDPQDVTFHEIGAWDSIVDIVSIALCLDYLQITDIFVSFVPTGMGTIQTAHGMMPIPAPATLLLLQGFNVIQDSLPFERTTPTGAAVLAALAKSRPKNLSYIIEQVGIGIGSKDVPDVPNILRCVIGAKETDDLAIPEEIIECSETNIDDSSPELLGYVHEQLMTNGALDIWFVPIQMKKQRPGVLVQVLHKPESRNEIHRILFQETTTLGVRYSEWKRKILPRESINVVSPWGNIRGKKTNFNGKLQFSPEFKDCRRIAIDNNIPLKDVYRIAIETFRQILKD